MQHTEGRFRGVGGLELYRRCWQPEYGSLAPRSSSSTALGSTAAGT